MTFYQVIIFKMKIVHLRFNLNSGGAENLVVDLINGQSVNNTVSLIVIDNDYDQDLLNDLQPGVNVHLLKRTSGSKNLLPFIKLNFVLNYLKPDIIHCHDTTIIRFLPLVQKRRTVLTIHGFNECNDLITKYGSVVAVSHSLMQEVKKSGVKNCRVILNGIDFSKVVKSPCEKKSEINKVVQVGRLDHVKKGQDILLRAIKVLEKRYGLLISVDFIGIGKSLQYLNELSSELNIAERVTFLGLHRRNDIYKKLYKYDILVQPSRDEAFGLSAIEGVAALIPVITSDVPALKEIGEPLGSWISFESGNEHALAEKMYVLHTEIAKHYQHQDDRLKKAEVLYSIDRMVKEYEFLYSSMLNS